MAFLFYSIVRYGTLNIKMLEVKALVIGQGVLLFALLFVQSIDYVRAIVLANFVLLFILGVLLARGVKKEIKSREQIEYLVEQLADANKKLRELDKQKSELISLASHQLRSPLTSIKGYSSMLLEGSYGKFEGKSKEILERIFQSSQRLVVIIHDFLNLSRIEQGKMTYEKSNFDLENLVYQIIDEMDQEIKNNDLTITFKKTKGASYEIYADQDKIRQVIINLIDNSIKYTNKGGIKVKLEPHKNNIRLEIADTGIGVSKDFQNKIFEKFYQADKKDVVDTKGIGLGLFVAKKIMADHGGEIGVISEGEGKGSTFFLEFKSNK